MASDPQPQPQPLAIPVLTGSLPDGSPLSLRPHRDTDRDAVLQRCRDPEVVRWTTVPSPYTVEMLDEYLASLAPNATGISWAIEADGTYAGSIDLRIEHRGAPAGHDVPAAHANPAAHATPAAHADPTAPAAPPAARSIAPGSLFGPRSNGEIGYVTSPHARRRGLMSQAVGMVLDHGFGLGLATIAWKTHVPNFASVKSAWRHGFVPRFVEGGLSEPRPGVVDIWHGLLATEDPRTPQGDWDTEVLPRLQSEAAAARFPN